MTVKIWRQRRLPQAPKGRNEQWVREVVTYTGVSRMRAKAMQLAVHNGMLDTDFLRYYNFEAFAEDSGGGLSLLDTWRN